MRQVTLMNLAASHIGSKNGVKEVKNFMNHGCITSPIKSLDLLRKNLQNAINRDIDCVIKKYLEVIFLILSQYIIKGFLNLLEVLSTCC